MKQVTSVKTLIAGNWPKPPMHYKDSSGLEHSFALCLDHDADKGDLLNDSMHFLVHFFFGLHRNHLHCDSSAIVYVQTYVWVHCTHCINLLINDLQVHRLTP